MKRSALQQTRERESCSAGNSSIQKIASLVNSFSISTRVKRMRRNLSIPCLVKARREPSGAGTKKHHEQSRTREFLQKKEKQPRIVELHKHRLIVPGISL